MTSLLYFAYGSNMYSPRLRFRVPGCVPIGTASLVGRALRFHKRGADGSGKCDAHFTGKTHDVVIGVLYRIPESEKPRLDTFEGSGKGYFNELVSVIREGRVLYNVATYVADIAAIDAGLRPYQWYKDFVVLGALEHGLPGAYVEKFIASAEARGDPDPARASLRSSELALL